MKCFVKLIFLSYRIIVILSGWNTNNSKNNNNNGNYNTNGHYNHNCSKINNDDDRIINNGIFKGI